MGYHAQAMDITVIFKSCVKSIRTRNRACGIPEPDRPRKESRAPSPFAVRAREVLHHAAKIGAFVAETRTAYMNLCGHIIGAPEMTDLERDKIDIVIPRLAAVATNLLRELEENIGMGELNPQLRVHQFGVVRLLRDYLRLVISIHREMRAARVMKASEAEKMSRLDAFVKKEPPVDNVAAEKNIFSSWTPMDDDLTEEALSPEELQMFQEENHALLADLNSTMEDVRQLEGKVAGVAQLQGTLTEKVLEQEHDIENIANAVIGTTENLKDANEQLREAIQRNAGFRVYILFFLLVMSFSLLFLDWY